MGTYKRDVVLERIAKVSSFPRKRESMTRLAADSSQSAPVDSRFRGNDGGCGMTEAAGMAGGVLGSRFRGNDGLRE